MTQRRNMSTHSTWVTLAGMTVGLGIAIGATSAWAQASSGSRASSSETEEVASSRHEHTDGASDLFERSETLDLKDVLNDDTEVKEVAWPELMEVARERAPRIREARSELERGEARLEGAEILLPYEPRIRSGVERFPFGEFSFGEARVGLTQRFQIGGERGKRIEAARAFRRTLRERLDEARWRVHAELHRFYNLALVDRKRLRLAVDVCNFAERLVDIARQRVDGGAAPEMARHVADAELARARQQLIEARSRFVSRLHELRDTSGWKREALPLPASSLPKVRSPESLDTLLEQARQHYPPVKTQRRALDAAQAEHDLAHRRVWPDPTLGLFYKRNAPRSRDATNGMIAQVALPIPLWNRNRAEREATEAEVSIARTKLRTLLQRLEPRLEDTIQDVTSAAERVEVYRDELLPAFRRQLSSLETGYKEGQFDITEVTVAREQLLENQRRALQAREAYVRAAGKLETLLGREFWRDSFDSSTQGDVR